MKNSIILFCLLFITAPISAQWITQTTTKTLNSVYFTDSQNGWAVGYVGTLLRTTDSGLNWNTVDLGYLNDFNEIIFVNYNYGWIVGGEGLILKTTDGGGSWFQQNSGVNFNLVTVFFIDENNGWISTNALTGEVLKTTNSGETWNSYPTGINFYSIIFFTSINNGWTAGWGGVIARTSDGGVNWLLDSTQIGSSFSDIIFISENIGWIVGNSGRILKTNNGGNTWNVLPFNAASFNIFSVFFIDENTGWITGVDINSDYGKIFKTTDGGITWDQEISTYEKIFHDIFFVDSEYGWAVGWGLIAKYDTTKSINIISPNGGEVLDTYATIVWKSNNVSFVNLSYSPDNGLNWKLIADSVIIYKDGNPNFYWWGSIPKPSSNQCLIKIVDLENSNVFDISDSNFTIIPSPGYKVIQPNGGEGIVAGSIYTIYWLNNNSDLVNILLSLDNGKSWVKLSQSDSYGYDWNVPDTTSRQCLIKIQNAIDTSVYNVSDNVFNIIRISKFSYFPLSVGNKWFFSRGIDGVIKLKLEVERDTLLSDGFTYAKLNMFYMPTGSVEEGYSYLRQEGNKIIKYPDKIILDFNMEIGDSVSTFKNTQYSAILSGIYLYNIFGRYLSTYEFSFASSDYYSYSDSIGFRTLYSANWNNLQPEYLLGCVIDGFVYGNTITDIKSENKLPDKFYLSQNYPNPFNPITKLSWQSPVGGWQTLKVYDVLGNEVATLVDEFRPAGNYEVDFNANKLSSGVYLYKLQAGSFVETKKMILMK